MSHYLAFDSRVSHWLHLYSFPFTFDNIMQKYFKLSVHCNVSFMTYFLLNMSVFEELFIIIHWQSVVMDALLRFTAMHYMNKLCKLLFIVVLLALFMPWWLYMLSLCYLSCGDYFELIFYLMRFLFSLSPLLWFVHISVVNVEVDLHGKDFTRIESILYILMWWN